MVTDGGITAKALQHVLLTDCTPQLVITISGTVYWDDDTIIYPRDPACGLSPSQAHVRIYGQAGAHIIQTAVNGTGASKPIFHVTADNVAIESLVMTGNDIGNIDLVGGSALSFHGASASGGAPPAVLHGGVIREVTFNGWGTAAVDSRWSVGMLIEDNVINCASGAQSYPGSNQSMGISVRNDGLMGGNVIQRNTIRNCLVEAIILEGASGDTVRLNDIDCVATFANGGKCSAGIALAGRITIDSDGWNPCGPAPSSNNLIQSNDIHGPRIQAPIILYGNGPAQYNTVRQNGIYLSRGHGIQIADGVQSGRAENDMCEISTPAIDRSLHAHNVIHNNVIEDVAQTGIWIGSHYNWLAGNTVRRSVNTYSAGEDGILINGSNNELYSNTVYNAHGHAFHILGAFNISGVSGNENGAFNNAGCATRYYSGGSNYIHPLVASGNGGVLCPTSAHASPL